MLSLWNSRRGKRALLALPALATLACSDLTNLEQEDPSQILARDAYAPQNAQLLVNGAIGDFECAFHRYVVAAGLLGDELVNAFPHTANYDYDRRTHPTTGVYGTAGCGSAQQPGVYTPLSVARASSDAIVGLLEGWNDAEVPNRQRLIGQSAAYAGYSLLLLGEGMCSAALNGGPELNKTQLWQEARARFDKTIAAATAPNDATTLNFARLGRARTLLNLGDLAAAATDAAQIPANFVVNALAADGTGARRQNMVFIHIIQSSFSSVDPTFENVTFEGVRDPRVDVVNTGRIGGDNRTPLRQARKYASAAAPIPIARTAEAQLIVAEQRIATGDLVGAVAIINALHRAVGIPEYDGTGKTAAEVRAQVLEERRRELFLEGQRLGDMNRYNLPLIPAVGTPFPAGGSYGDQRCFPLPDVERNNNPNIPNN